MNLEKKLKHYRLSRSEFDRICSLLGREPQGLEWGLFSALWSEHCSYKSSRVHLKKFFNKNDRVITSEGENAGVIDLGQGEKLAFKMESHNHPSFIEPYEGAATGVGGILRDIFTMGARPIALANYLCFGDPEASRQRVLIDGVVRGIGGYGNCVGVPTVTGQTEFHSSYNSNILVNAMAVGYFGEAEKPVHSKASGPGNWVVYVGAKTGRDGIHGASMASESFDNDSQSKRPTIQKGDPFFEKLLIEACLQVIHSGLVVAIQDMGAAGLTSSSFEMAAKGEIGFDLNLDLVPLRDPTLTAEDIMLSESQERMLLVCRPENFAAIQKVFNHWDLDAVKIGEVIKERKVRLRFKGELVCEMDPHLLTENAPLYERPFDEWTSPRQVPSLGIKATLDSEALLSGLQALLAHPQGTSRKWIYEQYDQRVGARTFRDASSSVAVVKLPESGRALGVVLGCRPYLMRMDALIGGFDSVFFPALELCAKGFLPLAVTDCLNFGNPENRGVMGEFVAALRGLNAAAKWLNTPVISGNVSFYNETLGKNITSTPATGLVGLRDWHESIPKDKVLVPGSRVMLLSLGQLQCEGLWAEVDGGDPGNFQGLFDIAALARFADGVRHLAMAQTTLATRVVGKLGLPYALARMGWGGLSVQAPEIATDRLNFHERLYEVIFVIDGKDQDEFEQRCRHCLAGVAYTLAPIGSVVRVAFVFGPIRLKSQNIAKT